MSTAEEVLRAHIERMAQIHSQSLEAVTKNCERFNELLGDPEATIFDLRKQGATDEPEKPAE